MAMQIGDPCTQSNYNHFRIDDITFHLRVSFELRKLFARTEYRAKSVIPAATLVLDTLHLDITGVKLKRSIRADYVAAEFQLLPEVSPFGQALSIDVSGLELQPDELFHLEITSSTTANCTALQWLSKEETAGKSHPYVFSQCQAIHARSLAPFQDTPGAKFTYQADVLCPNGLTVVMSGLSQGQGQLVSIESADGYVGAGSGAESTGLQLFRFTQKLPIPSYLVAIAAGNLVAGDLSERCAVWTEPELLSACTWEFAEVEQMLRTAESLCGPFLWERYDFLVLPPSFPYGGMENPNMTFLSPTLVAGDRSMVRVVAHELSHSWSGNLVTNCSWNHFWLNEGWTVFLERKIESKLNSHPEYRQFSSSVHFKHLTDSIQAFDAVGDIKLTSLVVDHSDIDPDDSFSRVPYEKGSGLLYYLENLLGGAAVFDPYVKRYFEDFQFKTLDTTTWKDHLYEYFSDQTTKLDALPWNDIFLKRGAPVLVNDFSNELTDSCEKIVKRWLETPDNQLDQEFVSDDFSKLLVLQKQEILYAILETAPKWSSAKYNRFTKGFALDRTKNCELLMPWIRIGLQSELSESIAPAVDLVTRQGRLKFTRPVYRALYHWDKSWQVALDTLQKNKKFMNPITIARVSKDLYLTNN